MLAGLCRQHTADMLHMRLLHSLQAAPHGQVVTSSQSWNCTSHAHALALAVMLCMGRVSCTPCLSTALSSACYTCSQQQYNCSTSDKHCCADTQDRPSIGKQQLPQLSCPPHEIGMLLVCTPATRVPPQLTFWYHTGCGYFTVKQHVKCCDYSHRHGMSEIGTQQATVRYNEQPASDAWIVLSTSATAAVQQSNHHAMQC